MVGNCEIETSYSLSDRSKVLYAKKLENNNLYCPTIAPTSIQADSGHVNTVETGWALKQKKKFARFTPEQKEFMLEKYNIGKCTGSKVDPYVAATEMRSSGRFERMQFLTGQQIASYFSRLAQKERKLDDLDFSAAKQETNKMEVKKEILSVLSGIKSTQ